MPELTAEIVRITQFELDIKLMQGDQMHVLQWRRNMLWDAVLLDGQRQAHSSGLFGREKVYGLEFGREEGSNGHRLMLVIDPRVLDWHSMHQKISGVRLEAASGPLLAYGSLDPRSFDKPETFSDWMKKHMGMQW